MHTSRQVCLRVIYRIRKLNVALNMVNMFGRLLLSSRRCEKTHSHGDTGAEDSQVLSAEECGSRDIGRDERLSTAENGRSRIFFHYILRRSMLVRLRVTALLLRFQCTLLRMLFAKAR